MEATVTRTAVIAFAAFATLVLAAQPAVADYRNAPWCAVVALGDGDMHWDCTYRSIEDCRPNVLAGNRGFCNPNPYWQPAQTGHRNRQVR